MCVWLTLMCLKLFVFVCISINSIVFDLINYEQLPQETTVFGVISHYTQAILCVSFCLLNCKIEGIKV